MSTLSDELIRTAAMARNYLDDKSRGDVIRFLRSRWNPDGGVRGRDQKSDLYYTVFAAVCMRALRGRMPYVRMWKFLRSFGNGEGLDAIHLFSLIRLRAYFPMSGKTKEGLTDSITQLIPESAYDMFFRVLMSEFLGGEGLPEAELTINASDPTTNITAAVVVNHKPDPVAEQVLLGRLCDGGGFRATEASISPDLLSTATALFALKTMGYNMDPIRKPCFDFIESLWRDSGGFSGHTLDQFEDPEYTYYALLSIGCLMG